MNTESYSNRSISSNALQNCTFVKTILMLLVILGHSAAFWNGNWFTNNPIFHSRGLALFGEWLGSFHIYAFTVVSGYIFAFKMNKNSYPKYIPFLKNKAKRLLVPYIFVAIVWVIPISVYFFHYDIWTVLKKYVLCISPSQLWFLWMLFDVFMISYPLWRYFCRFDMFSALLPLCLYVIGLVGSRLIPNVFCIWTACQYIPFFCIGIQIRLKHEKNPESNLNKGKSSVSIWLIVYTLLFAVNVIAEKNIAKVILPLLGLVLHIIGALAAFYILQNAANKFDWMTNKMFMALSACSMPMYLFHQQIIYVVISILNGKVNPYLNAAANFVISIVVSLFISQALRRFKLTRFLIGEK